MKYRIRNHAVVTFLAAVTALACLPVSSEVDASNAAPEFDQGHRTLTRVLAEHVTGDRVDYAALAQQRAALDEYLDSLADVPASTFSSWSREQQFAFWVNAYNGYTLRAIVDHYPLKSIRDIEHDGQEVWDIASIELGKLAPDLGRSSLSLNDIEHEILRKRFRDPRIHAAVNCASVGCPPLLGEAFVAERLDEQLDAQVRTWLADETRNRFLPDESRVEISRIFEWFGEDFERDAGSVLGWIRRYAPEETARWLAAAQDVKVGYVEYDWNLNAVR